MINSMEKASSKYQVGRHSTALFKMARAQTTGLFITRMGIYTLGLWIPQLLLVNKCKREIS